MTPSIDRGREEEALLLSNCDASLSLWRGLVKSKQVREDR